MNDESRTAPPLARTPMAPCAWDGSTSAPGGHWHWAALIRRLALLVLVAGPTALATRAMADVLPYHGARQLEIAILVFFALLFFWVCVGFWTAVAGFFVQWLGHDRYSISGNAAPERPIPATARTALVMPICNEDVRRVFAGLRATWESLERSGAARHFDCYVLSDSNDADRRTAELDAWERLCRDTGAFGSIFYRWRRHRIKRKSGNIADFCRRWGRNYRYMVVLDADSVMSGACLTRLVRLMEANPDAGIIQTAPCPAGRDTMFARIHQYASRVYGPLFTSGLHFWQLGESPYWGHNAIIRMGAFMRHCALARLPGRGSLSGEILSHDFVEAALMRRAGWGVWIAYDLPGSYEELPANFIEELQRDRRWCRGNLINFRMLLADGLHPAHRVVFLSAVMSYASAALWFLFLALCTALVAQHVLLPPVYFTEPDQLFPLWPEWHPARALGLLGITAVLLYLPKLLSVSLLIARGAQRFGSGLRLAAGMVAESVFSALAAPVRMLFHTRFVIAALLGRSHQWQSPAREDAETGWAEAMRRHGADTVLGIVWTAALYFMAPAYVVWFAPVTGALILSIPLSVYTSRVSLGRRLRRARLLMIPEESWPPAELRATRRHVARAPVPPGFLEAVTAPAVNALACAAAGRRQRRGAALARRARLVRKALAGGPAGLTNAEKMALLDDRVALRRLHLLARSSPGAHPSWHEAGAPVRSGNAACAGT